MKNSLKSITSVYVSALLCTGCSTNETRAPNVGDDTSAFTITNDTSYEVVDTEVVNSAAWFSLDATVTLEEGKITSTTLTMSTYAEEHQEILCVDSLEVLDFNQLNPPYESIELWWSVDWEPSKISCTSPSRMPSNLIIGMGDFHDDLDPYLSLYEISDADGGAYISFGELDESGDERVYVYGYITQSDLDGTTQVTPDDETGDQDDSTSGTNGLWEVHGLFLFPLAETEESSE